MSLQESARGRSATVDSAFRVLASLIFVVAGFGHLTRPESIVGRLEASSLGATIASIAPASALVLGTGVVLLVGGLLLLLGLGTRWAALALLATLVPITLSVQLEPGQLGPLFKNVALFGMLLHFASSGSTHHAFSLDALWSRRRMRGAAHAEVSV